MKLKKLAKPKAGLIFVKKVPVENPITKKIVVPEDVDVEASMFAVGEVTAVGEDYLNYKMQTKVGDKVLISKNVFSKMNRYVTVGKEKHFLIEERDYFWGWL